MPLYFFWTACSSGWIICIPREALICLKKSGMRTMRMTITRATIDSTQAVPGPAAIPSVVKSQWDP